MEEVHAKMTFLDFVLSMWNFLTADETVMIKNLFEYIEVGLLGDKNPVGVIPLKHSEQVGRANTRATANCQDNSEL